MSKKYVIVPNEKRRQVIDLIYNKGMTIAEAAKKTKIYYATAKAINNVYITSGRTDKKAKRNKKRSRKTVLMENTILQMPLSLTDVTDHKPAVNTRKESMGVIQALYEEN